MTRIVKISAKMSIIVAVGIRSYISHHADGILCLNNHSVNVFIVPNFKLLNNEILFLCE